MGRLSCQPGELFYPRQFAVHDLAELAAPRLLSLLERCGEVLPAWLRHNLQQLWHVEFIARPMQVGPPFLRLAGAAQHQPGRPAQTGVSAFVVAASPRSRALCYPVLAGGLTYSCPAEATCTAWARCLRCERLGSSLAAWSDYHHHHSCTALHLPAAWT